MKRLLKLAGGVSVLAMAVASTTASADALTHLNFNQNASLLSDDGDATTQQDGCGTTTPVGQDWCFDGTASNLSGLDFGANPTDTTAVQVYETTTHVDMDWNAAPGDTDESELAISDFDSTDSATKTGTDTDYLLPTDADGLWGPNEFWAITKLIQTNDVLDVDGSVADPLWIVDAAANFYIMNDNGIADADIIYTDPTSRTTIEFWESNNNRNSIPGDNTDCTGDNPLGTVCDDEYRVSAIALSDISFDYLGYRYTIEFGLAPGRTTGGSNLVTLVCSSSADPGCSGVTVPDGQILVFTPEGSPGTSSIYVTAAWSAREISEPSVLALFGIGALGLGLAGRRRKRS